MSDHRNRRIAGIVIDIFESHIHSTAIVIVQNNQVISVLAEHGLQNIKMDRTHLRRKNGIPLFPHFFGELCSVIRHRLCRRPALILLSHSHSREQAADSDTDSAEIGDLVDLQKRIQLAGSLQNLAYLICRYGIKSASERIELNHLQFIMLADKFRCIVQPGMIYPLIHNTQGPGRLKIDGKTILSKNRQTVGGNQFRDPVVDFGVDMIRPPRQHDSALAVMLHLIEQALAFRTNICLDPLLFCPCRFYCRMHLRCGNIPFLTAELYHAVSNRLFIGKRHKWAYVAHGSIGNGFHIVFDVFRI